MAAVLAWHRRPRSSQAAGGEHLPGGCPMQVRVAVIVERLELADAAEHVVQLLHALPGRVEVAPLREYGARNSDKGRERREAAGTQQPVTPSRKLAHNCRELACARRLAGYSKEAWSGRIEGCRGRECCHVVPGRNIHR